MFNFFRVESRENIPIRLSPYNKKKFIQLFLKKFQSSARIQIVYAYHYDRRLMICVIFPVSQLERVYDTHIYTRII